MSNRYNKLPNRQSKMRHSSLLTALLVALTTMMACSGKQETATTATGIDSTLTAAVGDSTIYGLACDGCTDTILVLLRNLESNPDTFNILNATRQHRIFGVPKVGDKLAIVCNSEDSTVADIVIDMKSIQGTWCYLVMPSLRLRADMPEKSERQLLRQMPDSVRDSLMVPREYGFKIHGGHSMSPVGMRPANERHDEEELVEYPLLRRYRDWRLFNGNLILSETAMDSLGNVSITHSDTVSFVLLDSDTLALRFKDGVQGYYKK